MIASKTELAAVLRRYSPWWRDGRGLVAHFPEYLLRGGSPQTALMGSIMQAQKLLRQDIVQSGRRRDSAECDA